MTQKEIIWRHCLFNLRNTCGRIDPSVFLQLDSLIFSPSTANFNSEVHLGCLVLYSKLNSFWALQSLRVPCIKLKLLKASPRRLALLDSTSTQNYNLGHDLHIRLSLKRQANTEEKSLNLDLTLPNPTYHKLTKIFATYDLR